jgi:hypothetical protein
VNRRIEDRLHKKHHPSKRTVFSIWYLAVLSVAVGVMLYFILGNRRPTNPLSFPVQIVINHSVKGVSYPSVILGDDVIVRSVKCNSSKKTLLVHGDKHWISITPAGTVLDNEVGVSTREPGCVSTTYINPMPLSVQQRNKALFAQGLKFVEWQIIGSEAPDDGSPPRSWRTETFRVYPPPT